MLICFDRPKTWFNRAWCIAFDQRWCHVRILYPTQPPYVFFDWELTWDGAYAGATIDVRENFPNLDMVVCIPCRDMQRIHDVFSILNHQKIRYSVWTSMTALFTGSFPGFTCASATWYALSGFINHNILPDDIYEALEDERV